LEKKMNEIFSGRLFGISGVLNEIDDWCGTKYPGWHPPKKKNGLRDVLITIVIHNLAAQLADASLTTKLQSVSSEALKGAGEKIISG
jgi:hypothetical protein